MDDKIVISGIGGRFPESFHFDEFKARLLNGEDLLRSDPNRTNRKVGSEEPLFSGKIPEWNHFDPIFFGVHPIMAHNSDPIKGQILERAFEAFLDSGTNPFDIKGRNVAVLVATGSTEADSIRFLMAQGLHALGMIGTAKTMMANRISYFFNFTGPSYQCDESGSGGIILLEQAAELIRQGQAESAIVATVNQFLWDSVDVEFNDLNLLSPDRKCRPFDDRANGTVRSEGVVALYLQRAQDAKRNYCTILEAKTTYLGNRLSSFVNVCPEYKDFVKNVYKEGNIDPSKVAYVEANCCSKHDLDSLDLNTINDVLKKKDGPLLIGSVAGNVGNGQAASGFLSLAKAITALETGIIPKTLNYEIPNSNVPALLDTSLKPVTEHTQLDGDMVAVTHLGYFGTVSHVVLERQNRTKEPLAEGELPEDGLYRLALFQARHEEAVSHILKQISDTPLDTDFIGLVNDLFKNQMPAYMYRGYAVFPSIQGKCIQNMLRFDPAKRPVWYIFSGMGSQWAGMGRDLLQFPVFAAAIDKCDKVLRPRGLDIRHIITADDPTLYDNILNCFVGIAAVQIGLVDILSSVGVTPDGMIGHSVGELGCGYADGCFSAEETILAAYARGKASLDTTLIPGMMAAIGLGNKNIKDKVPASIDVACHNSRDSSTLSGPTEDINKFVNQLQEQGVFARAVSAGGIAYHSRYIRDVGHKLLEYLKEVLPNPKPRSSKWISSSVPEGEWNTDESKLCSAEYHTNNLLNPVLFEEACRHLPQNAVLIEIAPRGLLQAILRRSIPSACVSLSMTNRNMSSNVQAVLDTLGKLFLHNVDVNVNALYPPLQYPVPRNTPGLARLATYDHDTTYYSEYMRRFNLIKWNKNSMDSRIVEVNAHVPEYNEWKNCSINGQVFIPFSSLLGYVREIYMSYLKNRKIEDCLVYEDVTIKTTLNTSEKGRSIAVHISSIGNFEITEFSESGLTPTKDVLRGTVSNAPYSELELSKDSKYMATALELERIDVINYLKIYGVEINDNCQLIERMWIGTDGCSAEVKWTGDITWFLNSLLNIVIVFYIDVQQQLFYLTSLKKLEINTQLLSTLPEGTIVDVFYEHFSRTLHCDPVNISGLSCKPETVSKAPTLTWTYMSLQPYFDTNLSITNFISTCIQLATEKGFLSWSQKPVQLEMVFMKQVNDFHIIEDVKESTKMNKYIKVKVAELEFQDVLSLLQKSTRKQRFLVVGDSKDVLALSGLHENHENVLYLTHLTSNHLKQVVPLLAHKHEGKCYVLLKLVKPMEGVKCYEVKDLDWLQNLRQIVKTDKNETPVIVHTSYLSPTQVLPVLALEPYADRVRTVFIEDKEAPQFDLNSPFYHSQVRLGLPVNILSNKVWSSLRHFSIKPKPSSASLRNNMNKNITDNFINYIGFNRNLNTISSSITLNENSNEVRFLDYSGVENGKKVMGVAKFDPLTNSVTLDPILKWEAPDIWSLEDLATIPATYSLAYLVLLEGKLKPSESVLIHLGMSLLGQALVNLCLNLGATVYVSVNDDNAAIDLQKQFPQLLPDNIVILERQSLKQKLKIMTKGEGVDLIFNGHLGKHLQDALGLVKQFGKLYHLGDTKTEEEENLGLGFFFNNIQVRGIQLRSAISCDDVIKCEVQKVVDLGLKSHLIKPFKNQIFNSDQQIEALRNLNEAIAKKTLVAVNETPLLATNSSTIECQIAIVAGGKTDFWLDVVEWLVDQGCHKVVIILADAQAHMCYMRRIHKLVDSKKAALTFASTVNLDTTDNALTFLSEQTKMAPISSVFCVEMNENSEEMQNLDWASRKVLSELDQFVCLFGEGTSVCESRYTSGLPVISIQGRTSLQSPRHILPYLATILKHTQQSYGNIFWVEDVDIAAKINESDYESFLPSLDDALDIVDLDKVEFHEVATLSPGYSYVGHCLLPVFVIPGLGSIPLQPLLKQLFNPTFYCSWSFSALSLNGFAEELLQAVTNIQSRGPYNIVGESWSGPVAITLSHMLEAKGHQVHLFLIEGAPTIIRQRLTALNKIINSDNNHLLSEIHNETNENMTLLGDTNTAQRRLEKLKSSLDSLQSYFAQTSDIAQPLRGSLTIITREVISTDYGDNCQLSVEPPTCFCTEDKDYQQLISNRAMANFINDNVAFSWNN